MNEELLFFIYAFPALGSCQKIKEEEISKLEKLVLEEKSPSKEELQNLYPNAFRRMEEKLGKNYWTKENIKKYWWVEHNKIIDNEEQGYENAEDIQKELCKVKFWKVASYSKEKKVATLEGKNEETIQAINYRNITLNQGDYITTHKNHVIEKISKNDYCKYG